MSDKQRVKDAYRYACERVLGTPVGDRVLKKENKRIMQGAEKAMRAAFGAEASRLMHEIATEVSEWRRRQQHGKLFP